MQLETPDVIILRGAPGSGKSETAKCLSEYFREGVRLEVDTIRQMVISVDWKNQQEHINMLDVSQGLVLGFLKHGFSPVIVVDTFSGDKVNRFQGALLNHDRNLQAKIFGLYTSDEELQKRLELRPDGEFKDFPISKKLNSDTLRLKRDIEILIDTTGLTPKQSAEMIYELLKHVVP